MNYKYRLFGRSKGRGKKSEITASAIDIKIKNLKSSNYNIIDIGTGYGESAIEFAKLDKKKFVIACEKYIDGINNIAKNAKNESLKNLFIFNGNVHQFLDECCKKSTISEIWILFPDPWPKNKHFKRRLIDINFLKKLKKFLKKNGIIHIASDSKSYISQILKSVFEAKNYYLWINQSKEEWDYKNLSLPQTKYYKKALKNGLNPLYLKLVKI